MIADMWRMFPRLIEQKINGLLDEAAPTALRSLQIYRALRENHLFSDDTQAFSRNLHEFFARPRAARSKGHFDTVLNRPMSHEIYSLFSLDFRTAAVSDAAVLDVASWAHNLIRVAKKASGAFMSLDVMAQTIRRVTTPHRHEKAARIEYKDFSFAWRKTVVGLHGHCEEELLSEVLQELDRFDQELKSSELRKAETALNGRIFLSETEIDWIVDVRKSAMAGVAATIDLSYVEHEKPLLSELERVVRLYNASLTSRRSQVIENRDRIRSTVVARCDFLLGDDLKLSA